MRAVNCMSELCGRAEAMSAALLPVVAQLSAPVAAAQPRTAAGNDAPNSTAAPAVAATNAAMAAAAGAVAVDAATAAVAVAQLQAELRRVKSQLHERARKYAGVLKAVVAGKQLPGRCGCIRRPTWKATA